MNCSVVTIEHSRGEERLRIVRRLQGRNMGTITTASVKQN